MSWPNQLRLPQFGNIIGSFIRGNAKAKNSFVAKIANSKVSHPNDIHTYEHPQYFESRFLSQ